MSDVPPKNQLPWNKYTILVGNPGVGKSAIGNGIFQKVIFKSGISIGKGLTQHLQIKEDPFQKGYFWGDTPGLSDIEKRKQAAKEIEKAMKKDGDYRIIFVLTHRSGRFLPDDILTMKLVLDALPCTIPFGIVINRVGPRIFELWDDIENQKKVMQIIFSKIRPTPFVTLIPETEEQLKDAMLDQEHSQTLLQWLHQIPFYRLMPGHVEVIDSSTLDEIREQIEKTIEQHHNQAKVAQEEWEKTILEMESQVKLLQNLVQTQQQTNQALKNHLNNSPTKSGNFFKKVFHIAVPIAVNLLF